MKKILLFLFLMLFSVVGVSAVLDDAVSYYSFDENTGTTAGDSAGSNDGTINGATWTTGKINSGLDFDGVDDFISTSLAYRPSSFTFSVWIKKDSTDSKTIISTRDDSSTGIEIGNSLDNFFIRIQGSALVSSGNELSVGEWQHLVFSWDGSTRKIFLNGNLIASDSYSTAITTGGSLEIARRQFSPVYFDGKIDEVGLWDRALTSTEITELYNNGDGLNPYTSQVGSLYFENISINNQTLINNTFFNTTQLNFLTEVLNTSTNGDVNQTYFLYNSSDNLIRSEKFSTNNLNGSVIIGSVINNPTREQTFSPDGIQRKIFNNQDSRDRLQLEDTSCNIISFETESFTTDNPDEYPVFWVGGSTNKWAVNEPFSTTTSTTDIIKSYECEEGLFDGKYNIYFYAENNQTNVTSQNYTFTIDTTPPTINNSIPNEINIYFFEANQFSCDDTNILTCDITINTQTITNNQNTTLTLNGNLSYTIFAEDLAGNTATETGTLFVNPFQYFYFEELDNTPITNFTLGGIEYEDFAQIKLYDLGLGSHSLEFRKFGFLADLINFTFTTTSEINQTTTLSYAKIIVNIRDKSTGNIISGENFSLQLISSVGVNQFTSNGTSEFQNILFKNNSYQVVVSNVNYFTEDIFFTFTNEEILNLNIYMTEVNTPNAGVVFISVVDGLGQPISNINVQALQWDSSQSSYIKVSEGLTGLDGRSTLNVILEDKIYKFKAFKGYREIISPRYRLLVTDNQKVITLTLNEGIGQRSFLLSNFNFDAKQLSYINNVSTIQVDWTNTNGIEDKVCIVAYRYRLSSEVKLQEFCKTETSTELIESFFINSSQNIMLKVELERDNSRQVLKTFRYPSVSSFPSLALNLGVSMFIIPLLFLGSIALGITIQNLQVGAMLVILSAGVSLIIVPSMITGAIVSFLSFVSILVIWAITGGRR